MGSSVFWRRIVLIVEGEKDEDFNFTVTYKFPKALVAKIKEIARSGKDIRLRFTSSKYAYKVWKADKLLYWDDYRSGITRKDIKVVWIQLIGGVSSG